MTTAKALALSDATCRALVEPELVVYEDKGKAGLAALKAFIIYSAFTYVIAKFHG